MSGTSMNDDTSVKVGGVEITLSTQALQDLCTIKRDSGIYCRAIDKIIRKLIDLGVGDDAGDKGEYIYHLRDLHDIKDHYKAIAGIHLLQDGEAVLPAD